MTARTEGGKKAAATIKTKFGEGFYAKIGSLGGRGDRGNAQDKGFASMDREKHRQASIKGGTTSRRQNGRV